MFAEDVPLNIPVAFAVLVAAGIGKVVVLFGHRGRTIPMVCLFFLDLFGPFLLLRRPFLPERGDVFFATARCVVNDPVAQGEGLGMHSSM